MTLKERLQKLLCVKSIVTIVLTAVVACLAIRGSITPEQLLTIYTVIIGFYFGSQVEKKNTTEGQ